MNKIQQLYRSCFITDEILDKLPTEYNLISLAKNSDSIVMHKEIYNGKTLKNRFLIGFCPIVEEYKTTEIICECLKPIIPLELVNNIIMMAKKVTSFNLKVGGNIVNKIRLCNNFTYAMPNQHALVLCALPFNVVEITDISPNSNFYCVVGNMWNCFEFTNKAMFAKLDHGMEFRYIRGMGGIVPSSDINEQNEALELLPISCE